jgi:pSer/pThr/pTyr-binding forkhead associated (FHA) protein
MGVVMVMFRSDGQRRSFSITRDMTVIGRREDCDLRIPLSDVSRKHCRLILNGETIKVEDLGSSNGTYINGERIQQSELGAGDTLAVGPVIFVVQMNGFPADDDLQPVTAATSGATTSHGAAADVELEEEEEVVDLETTTAGKDAVDGEFDPMEALESKEGSAFDFQIDESQHGEQSPVDLEESGQG